MFWRKKEGEPNGGYKFEAFIVPAPTENNPDGVQVRTLEERRKSYTDMNPVYRMVSSLKWRSITFAGAAGVFIAAAATEASKAISPAISPDFPRLDLIQGFHQLSLFAEDPTVLAVVFGVAALAFGERAVKGRERFLAFAAKLPRRPRFEFTDFPDYHLPGNQPHDRLN